MANQVNVSTTTNTVSITPQDTTNVNVGTTNTSVNVTQGSTSVVQVTTQGPQGPVGPQGPTGDANLLTGSLLVTASYANPDLTFTKGDGSTFNVGISTDTPTLAQVTAQGSSTTTAITASIISASGIISASNLSGTNTGDQDLSSLASITQLNASSSTLQSNIDAKASITQLNASSSTLQTNIDAKASITQLNASSSTLQTNIDAKASITQLNASSSTLQTNIDAKASITQLNASSSTLQSNIDAKIEKSNPSFTGAMTGSIISASGNLFANSLNVATSSVQDTYMMFIPRTSDGIANRSSYFLSFNPDTDALKHSNFGTNFNMSSSLYFNRVIACDDMSIASGKSIDMTGILHVEGATFSSNQVQIDLYTASITPNNTSRLPEPLEFTRAFLGDDILIDATSPNSSSHHFTQSFDISTLSPNSLIAVALSNNSPSTPVTTNTDVNLSLRITRNFKKKN